MTFKLPDTSDPRITADRSALDTTDTGAAPRTRVYGFGASHVQASQEIAVQFGRRMYSAVYWHEGTRVAVDCAYGTTFATTHCNDPRPVARRLLLQLLEAAKARGELEL